MNNTLLNKYEKLLAEKKAIEIARSLKGVLSDVDISKHTGLPLEKVKQL